MNEQIENKLKIIIEKLVLLTKQNAAFAKENESLKNQLEETKLATEKALAQIDILQSRLDTRKYSQALMTPEEKKSFEKKVNGYIKEIDKCIALLSI
jgi:small-conductance mechanosensitive channel